MDALPIKESTGLPYASQATGTDRFGQATAIAHSCGHDMHVVWLMGVTQILSENRDAWRGTVMAVFQPGEETAQGARAMIADGMVKRFPKPDVTLAQHVMPLSAGRIGWRTGTILSAGDSWEVTLFGRGAHGSMPQKSIDPVVMAASSVMRLQAVVSREVAMTDSAVVTVGTLRAGMSENVIPDHPCSGSTSAPSRTRCGGACCRRSSVSWKRRQALRVRLSRPPTRCSASTH
jgi:hippurate hydrolase